MVAAALPAMAVSGTAGAATSAPTLTCTVASPTADTFTTPYCDSGYAIIGQGFSGNFYASGGGFAVDQGLGGNVTLTTTAAGVTFSGVQETDSGDLSATITSTSATAPGFYPVTLTDDNGSVTMAIGLGVDVGPQITTITGNTGTVGGSSTILITGANLQGISASLEQPSGCTDTNSPVVSGTSNNTSATITVSNSGATPCTYTLVLTSPYPDNSDYAPGATVASFVVGAVSSALSITGINPSELATSGLSASNTSSTSTVVITGTGFEPGAVGSLSTTDGGVVSGGFVYTNSTTMTGSITLTYPGGAITSVQENILITNPDSTNVTGTGILGIGEPAASAPTSIVAPTIGCNGGPLEAGVLTIFTCTGSSTFPITATTAFSLSVAGNTTASEMVTGKVVSVTNDDATIDAYVPAFSSTTTTAALTTSEDSVTVASTAGIPTGAGAWIIDGASSEPVDILSASGGLVTFSADVANAHAAGVTLEWPFDTDGVTGLSYTVTGNNGVNSATSDITIDKALAPTYNGGANAGSFNPGVYTIAADIPGFGFTTGAAISFLGATGSTGTVTGPSGDKATLNVTVPATVPETVTETGATAGQDTATLSDTTYVKAGESLTVGPNPTDATKTTQTLVVGSVAGDLVTFTTNFALTFVNGDAVTGVMQPQPTGDLTAVITNGAGQGIVSTLLVVATPGTASLTDPASGALGDGAGAAGGPNFSFDGHLAFSGGYPVEFTTSATISDDSNWTVTSTTAGVTFANASASGTAVDAYATIASNVAASTTVPVTLTNGEQTFTGTITVDSTVPTVTGVTTVGTVGPSSVSETIGVFGTNFSATPMSDNFCYTTEPGLECAIQNSVTNSSTVLTVELTTTWNESASPASDAPEPFPANGSYGIVVGQYSDGGSGLFSPAVTVAGEPTVTAIAPTTVNSGTMQTLTLTGTGFNTVAAPTSCEYLYEGPTATSYSYSGSSCTATVNSATSVTITNPNNDSFNAGSVEVEFGDDYDTWIVDSPPTAVINAPVPYFFIMRNDSSINFDIAAGSTAAPYKLIGAGFLPGTTLSIPAADGTIATTLVTPNAVFGTATIVAPVGGGGITVTVTNANGTTSTVTMDIEPAPSILTVNGTATTAVLDGNATKLVITGTNFVTGATVATTNAALSTFGTVVVSNSSSATDPCTTYTGATGNCNTITVTISPLSFSGAVPIVTGLVVTNPVGDGSTTVQSDISINPVPAVTGIYYVPTFTTNAEVTINGSGFESGITASSSNPDYTVNAVASTPTTVTLLVTTDSQATSGTSSTVTLTNPDGGSTTFPLNGGPNPNTITPTPKATAVHGLVHTGTHSVVTISGTHFYGQPTIHSNAKGTVARVSMDNHGKLLTVKVTTKSTTPKGRHTFTIIFANGEQTSVKYTQVK